LRCCYATSVNLYPSAEEQLPAGPPPVEGLPIEQLAQRGGVLAKRWAIALIVERPALRIGEVGLEDVARHGPGLCGEVLRALANDDVLRRLLAEEDPAQPSGGPSARLAAMTGAHDGADTVAAVESLRIVLSQALTAELRASTRVALDPGRRIQDLGERLALAGERLAHVCALLAARSVRGGVPAQGPPSAGSRAEAPSQEPLQEPAGSSVRIVDERAERRHAPPARRPAAGPRQAAGEISVRDQRGGEGQAAWIDSIAFQLERFRDSGVPFAVLLVQVVPRDRGPMERVSLTGLGVGEPALERLLTATAGGPAGGASSEPGWGAVGAGRETTLTRERAGRYWLLAPGLDRAGAQLLAERLTRDISLAALQVGADLEVAVGTASCPRDGREAATLAAHADVGLYAARAAARASALSGGSGL
jgi:hypothetical protein